MSEMTPMMSQYLQIKKDYSDAILFFRLGDFYEMFFDDAITASKALELTLTARTNEAGRVYLKGYSNVVPTAAEIYTSQCKQNFRGLM